MHVADRAVGVFEIFIEQRHPGTVDLLMRSEHNRALGRSAPKHFGALQGQPVRKHPEIHVARSSSYRGTRHQSARGRREAQDCRRTALVAIGQPPPQGSGFRGKAPLRLNLVHVHESARPDGDNPLDWFRLTSLPGASDNDSKRVLPRYRRRRCIENWHRVLNSACKVECLDQRTGDHDAVMARWR